MFMRKDVEYDFNIVTVARCENLLTVQDTETAIAKTSV